MNASSLSGESTPVEFIEQSRRTRRSRDRIYWPIWKCSKPWLAPSSPRKALSGARSHGQAVYRRGNELISPDVDRHNGGIWKKATGDAANLRNKAQRDGTFNEDLSEMVGP